MPNPYVTKAELKDGKLLLDVRVDDYGKDVNVAISGEVSQDNEAFATFHQILSTNDAKPDATGYPCLTVTATPVDADKFDKGFYGGMPVSVVARVARVWLTVLSTDTSDPGVKAWVAGPDGGVSV
jgi:hypothetical protein